MTLDEAIQAINAAPDRHRAMSIANDVALECMRRQRNAADELAVRNAFHSRWGNPPPGPIMDLQRHGSNWTGD